LPGHFFFKEQPTSVLLSANIHYPSEDVIMASMRSEINKIDTKKKSQPTCSMCGLCCQLFWINLNEEEYNSRKYLTVFDDIEIFDDFTKAKECGANLVKKKNNGDCIYLKANKCSIHERRPVVCKEFFCSGTETKYEKMRNIVKAARSREI
jgi:Fe-S-cluster containining protein